METHFGGSRGGSESKTTPRQRQYDEKNPDNANTTDVDHNNNPKNDSDLASKAVDHPEDVDSKVNTDIRGTSKDRNSLTIDEDFDVDPNEVDDKPSFENDNN